jgi:hypothetical protein
MLWLKRSLKDPKQSALKWSQIRWRIERASGYKIASCGNCSDFLPCMFTDIGDALISVNIFFRAGLYTYKSHNLVQDILRNLKGLSEIFTHSCYIHVAHCKVVLPHFLKYCASVYFQLRWCYLMTSATIQFTTSHQMTGVMKVLDTKLLTTYKSRGHMILHFNNCIILVTSINLK